MEESDASDSEIRSPKNPYPPNTMIVCIGLIVYATAMTAARSPRGGLSAL